MQPSRQLMYFLLGLIIPFLAIRIAYAGFTTTHTMTHTEWEQYKTDRLAYWEYTLLDYDFKIASGVPFPHDMDEAITIETWSIGYSYKISDCEYLGVTFTDAVDTDNDGLPDECDFYPNDPTSYSVKLLTYFTDNGTETGNPTFQVWQTDRGDWFQVGTEPADLNTGFYVGGNSTWTEPQCSSSPTLRNPSASDPDKAISQPPVSSGPPSGDAPTDTDPTLQPGKKSDGTETGDAALRDIIDNTGDIATNTKRLGEYAKDLNTAIQNMDRNLTLAEERAANQELEKMQDELDAESGWADFTAYDVEAALTEKIDPTITEGPEGDYQEHGPLSEESWVTEFIDSNPISSVLSESGFQYSNSRCTADLNLGYLGQHSINICELEDGFIAFGQLLMALVTLTGLVHVITGRGF